jgi:hypothetical protein
MLPAIASCAPAATIVAPPAPRPSATATPVVPGVPVRARGLVGDTSAEVAATLGAPALLRHDGDAEFWLYATKRGCRVELVLYRTGGGKTVAHADANTPPHVSEAACLREIAANRGTVPAT